MQSEVRQDLVWIDTGMFLSPTRNGWFRHTGYLRFSSCLPADRRVCIPGSCLRYQDWWCLLLYIVGGPEINPQLVDCVSTAVAMLVSCCCSTNQTVIQPTTQSTNEPPSQPSQKRQRTSESSNQSVYQPNDKATTNHANQSTNKRPNQPIKNPTNCSTSHPSNRASCQTINTSTNPTVIQPTGTPTGQSQTNQSSIQPIHHPMLSRLPSRIR